MAGLRMHIKGGVDSPDDELEMMCRGRITQEGT